LLVGISQAEEADASLFFSSFLLFVIVLFAFHCSLFFSPLFLFLIVPFVSHSSFYFSPLLLFLFVPLPPWHALSPPSFSTSQADAFRSEHASRRQLERQLDALCQQVQRRMAAASAQDARHDALVMQQESTAAELAEALGQVRMLQAQLREAAGTADDMRREAALLGTALADKERQVAVLVAETERLQGRPVRSTGVSVWGCCCCCCSFVAFLFLLLFFVTAAVCAGVAAGRCTAQHSVMAKVSAATVLSVLPNDMAHLALPLPTLLVPPPPLLLLLLLCIVYFPLQVQMPAGAVAPAGGVLTGQQVISETLITFTSLQELVATNTKLQVVARTIAAEAEKTKEEVCKHTGPALCVQAQQVANRK
jgi:hypothetical protein